MSCLVVASNSYRAKGLSPALETDLQCSSEVECGLLLAEIIQGTMTVENFTGEGTILGFTSTGIAVGDFTPISMWDGAHDIKALYFYSGDTLFLEFTYTPSWEPTTGNMFVKFPGMPNTGWVQLPQSDGNYMLDNQTAIRAYLVSEDGNDIPVELTFILSESA